MGSGHLLQGLHETHLISASGKTHEVRATDIPILQLRKLRQAGQTPLEGPSQI